MSLVVVLLFLALFISGLMVSTSYVTLGTKSTAVNEARSTAALFAADSLLSRAEATFKKKTPFTKAVTTAEITAYLAAEDLDSITLANGATAALTVLNVKTTVSPMRVTLKSTGNAPGGGTQVVIKEYSLDGASGNALASAPGALNAKPPVYTNGQPIITGENGQNASGVLYDDAAAKQIALKNAATLTNLPYGSSTDLSLRDPRNPTAGAARINVPTYIELGSSTSSTPRQRFKVTAKTDDTVTVTPVNMAVTSGLNLTASYAAGTNVGLVPLAVTQPLGTAALPLTSIMNLPVTDPNSFYGTDKVFVDYVRANGTRGTAVGKVEARVADDGSTPAAGTQPTRIRVNFTSSACSGCTPIPTGAVVSEGTPVRRDIIGIVGASTVDDPKQVGQYTFSENDPRIANPYATGTVACPSGNLLFCETFKMDYNAFISAYPPVTKSDLNNLSGVTVVNGGNWNGGNGVCGSGILVVVGDFTANSSPQCERQTGGFRGLIYVTGNATMMGNLSLQGAMVVQGLIQGGEVRVGGSKNGDHLTYDLMGIMEAGQLLGGKTFAPIPGTWRQQ